jgi:hypothetical protein
VTQSLTPTLPYQYHLSFLDHGLPASLITRKLTPTNYTLLLDSLFSSGHCHIHHKYLPTCLPVLTIL